MLFKDISFDLFYIHIIDNLGSCVLLSVAVAKFFIIIVASIIYTPIHNSVYKVLLFSHIYVCICFWKHFAKYQKDNKYLCLSIYLYLYLLQNNKKMFLMYMSTCFFFFYMCIFFLYYPFFNKICQTNLSVVFFLFPFIVFIVRKFVMYFFLWFVCNTYTII